jgi:AmiR/NasT family two-component response regulator
MALTILLIDSNEERQLIERAKAILIKNRKMTEPEAYRWLQKKAMNEGRKLAQIVTTFVAEEKTWRPGPISPTG